MKLLSLVAPSLAALLLFTGSAARGESCVTTACHPAISALPNQHAPVQEGTCDPCHVRRTKEHPKPGGETFALAGEGAALCAGCHDAKGTRRVVHVPVKDGECVACHQPHGATGRALLNMGDDQVELCIRCHDRSIVTHKYMHGPVAVGSCSECHDPHDSDEKMLLKAPNRDLCLKCHADFAESLKAAQRIHPPVQDGPCASCHSAHGSASAFFVKKKLPDLCVDCHAGIGKQIAKVKVPHKPVMQGVGCSNCHSAHFSNAKGLLPFDEMTTCLSCHDKDNLGTPPLRNIKKEIAGKPFLHGPIKKGECKGCHDPHGSDNHRLLRGRYPAELYAPYKEGLYDACLKCHDKNLLRFPETTLYTGFRNGNRNLHFVHVADKRKGRTCRICHDPHASTGEKLISKDGAKFGTWKIPVNFKISPTGGSCSPGCHRSYKYDRNKPVDYSL